MIKPKITREEALKLMPFAIELNKVYLLGIRGYYKDSMGKPGENDRGIFDDAICVIAPGSFYTFNANTDPSVYRKGIAKLIPGTYPYKKGRHHITSPNGYWAFRPATEGEELPVTRDGETGTSFGVAINIHKGGMNSTSSEGCQTIIADQWDEFQQLVYSLMDRCGQKIISYSLIEK